MCLIVHNQEHFDKVCAHASQVGLREQLDAKLHYLRDYGNSDTKCHLYPDFAPHSFYFVIEVKNKDGEWRRWFNGGLIYHGPHDNGGDGSYPTLAVCVTPTDGWSVHT